MMTKLNVTAMEFLFDWQIVLSTPTGALYVAISLMYGLKLLYFA